MTPTITRQARTVSAVGIVTIISERPAQERKHAARVEHAEPRRQRQQRHRLVARVRGESVVVAVAPGLAEYGEIEKIRAGDHQKDDLPVERVAFNVLTRLPDEE